ncbi:MAG: hypothetical protein LBT83_00900, partial [Tannerella sp.]|nr:hypothetical protein [Tannerella sp.]
MVCALVVSSCEDKEKDLPEEPEFKIVIDGRSPSSYPFTADAAEMTIAVQSNGSWTVTVADDAKQWLHVSPAAGENDGSFTLNVDANTTTTARSGSIAFKVGDEAMSSLFVTQAAFGPSITVTPEIAEPFTSAGGDIVFTIAANADWQYSLGDADWLQEKEKSATSLTLTAIANTGVARTATVAFSMTGYPDMNQDVIISQAVAQSVILDEEDFGANATLTGVFNINASELEATIEG